MNDKTQKYVQVLSNTTLHRIKCDSIEVDATANNLLTLMDKGIVTAIFQKWEYVKCDSEPKIDFPVKDDVD